MLFYYCQKIWMLSKPSFLTIETRPDFLMGPFRCQSALSGYCWLRAGNALVEYFVVSGYHIEGSGMT